MILLVPPVMISLVSSIYNMNIIFTNALVYSVLAICYVSSVSHCLNKGFFTFWNRKKYTGFVFIYSRYNKSESDCFDLVKLGIKHVSSSAEERLFFFCRIHLPKYSTITIHMYLIHIIIYHDINIGQKELHNAMQLYGSLCIFYETYENCTYRNHFCH